MRSASLRRLNRLFGFVDGPLELCQQLGAGDFAGSGEFGGAIALVFSLAERVDEPLAHIAVEVQHQVADGVCWKG